MCVRPISPRLLSGMLIPAIRAKFLPLPLLVSRVLADDENPPVAADDLALLAHRLDRRSYLHGPFRLMIQASGSGGRDGHRYHPAGTERSVAHEDLAVLSATPQDSKGSRRRRRAAEPAEHARLAGETPFPTGPRSSVEGTPPGAVQRRADWRPGAVQRRTDWRPGAVQRRAD